jgi:hypothetical protein
VNTHLAHLRRRCDNPNCARLLQPRKLRTARFCCDACRATARRREQKGLAPIKSCPVCYAQFVQNKQGRKRLYCSSACRERAFRKHHRAGVKSERQRQINTATLLARECSDYTQP